MKQSRLAVLGLALVAGGAAAYLRSGDDAPPPVAPQPVAAPVVTAEVLVATSDIQIGQTLRADDIRWIAWPDGAVAPGYLTRTSNPKAIEDAAGAIARTSFLANEPIRPEKLVKSGSGFMSAILPPGMRAMAVTTDARGTTSAGGFVLPGDRVDIIKIFRDEANNNEQSAETLLRDVRVLAVAQAVQEKNGVNVVTGDTTTLALTPSQAEMVTLAQKVGQLSLVLRSIQDTGRDIAPEQDAANDAPLTIVRFGVAKQQPRR